MEIIVTLINANGYEVRTAYPVRELAAALAHFAQYVADGKRATIAHE